MCARARVCARARALALARARARVCYFNQSNGQCGIVLPINGHG